MTLHKKQHPDNKPDELLLLAYVENRLTDDERRTVERELADHPKLVNVLNAMSDDRQVMREVALDETVPDGLVDTVLMQIERTMLLDSAPDAPLVEMPRRHYGLLKRLAVAAAFVLLLSGVSIIVYQSLSSMNKDSKTLEEMLADGTAVTEQPVDSGHTEIVISPEDQPVEIVEADRPDDVVVQPDDELQPDPLGDDHRLAVEPDHGADDVAPPIDPQPRESLTTDLGYAALIECADREEAILSFASRLGSSGGGVLSNVPISDESTNEAQSDPAMANSTGENWSGAQDPLRYIEPIQPIPHDDQTLDRWLLNNDPMFASVEIVPIDEQLRYYDEGYDFTLIGTPTELRRLLRSLIQSDETRFKWTQRPVDGKSLDDIANPPRPIGPQWISATLWWLDPLNDLPKAQAAAMSSRTESLIRIPIRISESGR